MIGFHIPHMSISDFNHYHCSPSLTVAYLTLHRYLVRCTGIQAGRCIIHVATQQQQQPTPRRQPSFVRPSPMASYERPVISLLHPTLRLPVHIHIHVVDVDLCMKHQKLPCRAVPFLSIHTPIPSPISSYFTSPKRKSAYLPRVVVVVGSSISTLRC